MRGRKRISFSRRTKAVAFCLSIGVFFCACLPKNEKNDSEFEFNHLILPEESNESIETENEEITGDSVEKLTEEFETQSEESLQEDTIGILELSEETKVLRSELACEADVEEAIEYLKKYSDYACSFRIMSCEVSVERLILQLQENWKNNRENQGYVIQIYFYPEKWNGKTEPIAVKELPKLLPQEGKDLPELQNAGIEYIRLENVEGVDSYAFQCFDLELEREKYSILLNGSWQGEKIVMQYLESAHGLDLSFYYNSPSDYTFMVEDVNFDGTMDLLLKESYIGGSGGVWCDYSALTWDAERKQFERYDSFPVRLNYLDFANKRMVNSGQMGTDYQYVEVYEVVAGEYALTKALVLTSEYDLETEEATDTLSYYEMGELVQTHILTNWIGEAVELYPELDYWNHG